MIYRIERITDYAGNDRADGRYPQRVGREGHVRQISPGMPLVFAYIEPDVGTLVTSPVVSVMPAGRRLLRVKTQRSVYYLAEVEARDPEWPEPIDWEESDE